MKAEFTCKYCNFKWIRNVYGNESVADLTCSKCNGADITAKDLDKDKIDYYKGSLPFEETSKSVENSPDPYSWFRTGGD